MNLFKPFVLRALALAAMAVASVTGSDAATLRHHYPFNTNANDAMGVTNLTSVGDSVTFQASGGAAGGYLKLGGSDDYLVATAGSNLSVLGDYSTFRSFSLSFWVRQTAAQAASGTIGVIGMTTESTVTAASTPNYNTGFEVATRESSAGLGVRIRARAGGTGDGTGFIATGLNVANGSWHHIAVVFEAGGRSVYVDGVLAGSSTTAVSFVAGQPITRFAVGAFLRSNQIVDDLNGDVDDLQVYDGPLTETEALQLYQNPGLTLNSNLPPASTSQPLPEGTPLADVVDTMIGVAGGANTGSTVPGPCLPFASIYPSPDTVAAAAGGYSAGSDTVGFSQLHATGSGSSTMSFGNFLVSPRLGANSSTLEDDNNSPIANVVARPYSYRGRLTTPGIDCTVVPTANCAIYQFDFPASTDARIYFDVARKLNSSTGMTSGSVTVDLANGTVSGGGTFDGNWNPAAYNVYFYAKLDTTPASGGTWLNSTPTDGTLAVSTASRQRIGSWVKFNTSTNRTVRMKIGVSFQSVAKAQQYVESEIPAWDLAGLEATAKTRWNDTLSVLQTPGITIAEARKLYTALFHSLIQPRNRTGDPAGWPADAPFWDDQYTPWDTWQTLYPLLDIVNPGAVASIVNSFGERYARNGKAETAFIQGKDFQVGQGGDEVDRIIADAYVKGIPGIDWAKLWPLLQFNAGRRTDDYRNLGFVSIDGSHNGYDSRMCSGSSTIAFAHGDWCAAQIGASLGHTTEAQTLLARSESWRNVWDTTAAGDGFSGFVRGKNRNGTFSTTAPTAGSGTDFYQGSCWNYSFNIHDRNAMIDLMGGRARFIQRLEFAFGKGNTSYLDFGNEVNLQSVPLLSRALRPGLSAYWAENVRTRFTTYNCPGDEDSGAMSSLYFFLTAGFVPAATEDTYYLHGPRVPRLDFNVGGGHTFTVTAANAGSANLYVQSATLDGQPLSTPVIHHSDIAAGKTLAFVMGPNPTTWGTGEDFSAPTRRDQENPVSTGWSAALGSPQITGATTDSPVWGTGANGADNTAIYSAFPELTLSEPGSSVTLTATVALSGMATTQAAPNARFAWGLFNANGQSGVTGWPGYLAGNDTVDATGKESIWRKDTGNSTAFHSSTSATTLTSYSLPVPAFADGTYRLAMTLSRTASGALDYHAAFIRASDNVLFAAFTGSDLTPPTYTFNRVGLRVGDVLDVDSVQVTQATVVANGIPTPPTVSIVAPAVDATFMLPAAITVSANATASAGETISKVEFFANGDKIGETIFTPFDFAWSGMNVGAYALTAKATDNHGETTTSAAVNITVTSIPPSVALTAPVEGASFPMNGTVHFAANATGSGAAVTKVEFFAGAMKVGENTAEPFTFDWTGLTPGAYQLTAKATDERGATTISAAVAIAVVNAAPTVALTSPDPGESYDAPASVYMTANAADIDGSVVKVEYFANGSKVGEASAAPYAFFWSNVHTGTYAITAKATDNGGGFTASDALNVSVANTDNAAPSVAITAPASGILYTSSVTIAATASDTDGTVTKVEFFDGATKLGETASSPYSFAWSSVPAGTHTLIARATDNDGGVTTSSPVTLKVEASPLSLSENFDSMGTSGTTPPSGWSIYLANSGTNATWTDSIPIAATGTTSVATMVAASAGLTANNAPSTTNNSGYNAQGTSSTDRVLTTAPTSIAGGAIQWQVTNTSTATLTGLRIGYDTRRFTAASAVNELPGYWLFYSLDGGTTWTNVAALNPTLNGSGVTVPNTVGVTTVPATDLALNSGWAPGAQLLLRWVDDNAVATSPDQIIGLDNVTLIATSALLGHAPTVVLTAPTPSDSFNAPATINLAAQAEDSDGTVAKVEFYNGAAKIGEAASEPFSFAWTGVAAGTYSLSARAIDNDGNIAISSAVSVTVNPAPGSGTLTRAAYLQQAGPTTMTLRWRSSQVVAGRVKFGPAADALTTTVDESVATTEHEVKLTGLTPNTKYFYSVGSAFDTLEGADPAHFFVTSPAGGTAPNTRIWVLGDAGTGTTNQTKVRDAFYTWTGARDPNLVLQLGDNAYNSGLDAEFQSKVFDIYGALMRRVPFWSCLGNHETNQATSFVDTYPYFSVYSFPKNGECGGVASGTEHYYSWDYGNIHFISLDSMTASRSPTGAMATWLQNDLASTTATWIICLFHHPPYTKGSHDSDAEIELMEMRQNILPILEAGGVDLVLSGHSHCYERSYLLDGHYGVSSTLTSAMKVNGGDGRPTGTGAYLKPLTGDRTHKGAVYCVTGSAGQISGGSLNHPAHYISLNNLGSTVIDVSNNRLELTFVRETGATGDTMTLLKPDTIAPSITTLPPDRTLAVGANGQAVLPNLVGEVVAADNIGVTTITQSPVAGAVVGVGVQNVTITVSDEASNIATGVVHITAADQAPPSISGTFTPLALLTEAGGTVALPDYTSQAVANDNVGVANITQLPAAGTLVGASTVHVTLTARDASGNSASTSFDVVVSTPNPGALSFVNATVAANPVNPAGQPNVIPITLTRTSGSGGAVTVEVNAGAASPLSGYKSYAYGTDYEFVDAIATGKALASFADGQTSATVNVRLKATALSGKGRFALTLGSLTGGATTSAPTQVVVTITARDTSKPTLTLVTTVPAADGKFDITGTVKENDALSAFAVKLNGVALPLAADPRGTFVANTALAYSVLGATAENGSNTVVVEATDASGNVGTTSKKVSFANNRPGLAGTYNALLVATGTPNNDTTGLVSVTVTATGSFTGKVTLGGVSVPISGLLNNDGAARFKPTLGTTYDLFDKAEFESFLGTLAFAVNETNAMTGTLATNSAGDSTLANFTARNAPYSKTNHVPPAFLNYPTRGNYTVVFPGLEPTGEWPANAFPQGDGLATLTLSDTGSITLAGYLADGTSFSASSRLRVDDSTPIFAQLYRKRGAIAGELAFAPASANSDVSGSNLTWLRPLQPRARYFPGGWPAGRVLAPVGAKYATPLSLDFSQGDARPTAGNASLVFTGGLLPSPLVRPISIDPRTGAVKSVPPGTTAYKLSFVASKGMFSGTFVRPDGATNSYRGILLNKGAQHAGFGYFLTLPPAVYGGTGESGAVTIDPNGP